jgi:xanthine dehydrogenase iron-sulfur cluster and FAD-binding subunit A
MNTYRLEVNDNRCHVHGSRVQPAPHPRKRSTWGVELSCGEGACGACTVLVERLRCVPVTSVSTGGR